jgi:hypothetical protein
MKCLHITLLLTAFLASSLYAQDGNFEFIGQAMGDGNLLDIAASGNYVYIASMLNNPQGSLLTVVDLSYPARPRRFLIDFEMDNYLGFHLSDSLLFFSTYDSMVVFNISDPEAPSVAAIIQDSLGLGMLRGYGNYVAIAFQATIRIADFSDLDSVHQVCRVNCAQIVSDYAFYRNYLLVAEGQSGFYTDCLLEIFDLSNPNDPVLVYSSNIVGSRRRVGIEIKDHYMLLYQFWGDGAWGTFRGINLYDIMTPANPQFSGAYFQDLEIWSMERHGDYIFVGDSDSIYAIEFTNPISPQIVGAFPENAFRIFATNNTIYCRTLRGAVLVLDITDPGSLQFVSMYIPGSSPWSVTNYQNYAYVVDGNSGFNIVDISDPRSPVGVNYYRTGNQSHAIQAGDGMLILTDNYAGAVIYSLGDPLHPQLICPIITNSFVRHLYYADNILYLATNDPWDWDGGIYIYSIADPQNPMQLSHVPLPTPHGSMNAIKPHGNYLFVAEGDSGIGVYNTQNISDPQLIRWVHTPSTAADLDIKDDILSPWIMGPGCCLMTFRTHMILRFLIRRTKDPLMQLISKAAWPLWHPLTVAFRRSIFPILQI